MVQMCLARLLKFLNLDKICQTSLAEYHSKRNFVERAHAKENWMLSKHRQFKHKPTRKTDTPGSQQHMENMEHVTSEVIQCISQGSFGGSSFCILGVYEKTLFSLTKMNYFLVKLAGKQEYTPSTYSDKTNNLSILHHWYYIAIVEGLNYNPYQTIWGGTKQESFITYQWKNECYSWGLERTCLECSYHLMY